MEIFLSEIPTEGLHRSGTLPASIFQLDPEDSIRPAGEVRYEVTMFLCEDVVAFTGSITAPFQLQCGTCLEYVDFLADFPNWNADLELEENQENFDLAEIIREDFLLELPSHPRCDELLEGRTCPKADTIAAIESKAVEPGDDQGPSAWDALDQLSKKRPES